MKKLTINGNTCYCVSGQLAIDTEGEPIFAACEDGDTIESLLGMSEEEAVAEIEKWGEAVDVRDIGSYGIQAWGLEWAE